MNIRDIAAAAHVSVATVSKIMNHKDSEISEGTRQRVLNVIREYQYTPYSNLRSTLDTGRSQILAFIFQEGLFANEFILQLEKEVSRMGYSLIIYTLSEPAGDSLRQYLWIISQRKVEGILLGLSSPELLEEAVIQNHNRIPMASFSTFIVSNCTTFHLDFKLVAETAMQQLLKLGHRRIGCITNDIDPLQSAACIDGYLAALQPYTQYGTEEHILIHEGSNARLTDGIRELLRANVTAIFCQTSMLANITYEVLKEEKYYIPNNISVICGAPAETSSYFRPALTCCCIPTDDIIPSAINYLLNQIETHSATSTRTFSFKPRLFPGENIAPLATSGKQILVVGNCSTDYTLHVDHMPANDGFQVTGSMMTIPGGKAVVQAVGAGKLDGTVYVLGCVGNDVEGKNIITSMKDAFVHTEGMTVISSLPTGKAYILVASTGSSVISYPGANSAYTIEHIQPFRHLFHTSDYCLLSTELRESLVKYVVRCCEKNNIELFVKPASIQHFPDELFPGVTFFIPNLHELNQLVPGEQSYEEKAEYLYQKGCKNVIVTLGSHGCYLRNADYSLHIPAADFHYVDATGASNCFIAALAVSLSQEKPLLYSICYAIYAAGISITQPGVQASFPDRKLLDIYLDEIQDMYQGLTSD